MHAQTIGEGAHGVCQAKLTSWCSSIQYKCPSGLVTPGKMSLPSVSDYSLLEKIGSGSYATVYKAFKKVRTILRFGANHRQII